MWPVWFLGLFGEGKSFKANPFIGSRLLNRLGLHVLRVALARLTAKFRWLLLSPMMNGDERDRYHRDGYLVVDGFLSTEEIRNIKAELKDLKAECRQMVQGDTLTQRILLSADTLDTTSSLKACVEDRHFLGRLFYGGAKWHRPLLYIQKIRNGVRVAKKDPQKNMHADTFHPTMKAWLFLQDVKQEHGPFTYVKGSHRLTWQRLKWEYRRSITARHISDGYSEKGSFRADTDDLQYMELPDPAGLEVKAGTLVIANTNGFHGRGQAEANASRMEIWAYSRHNPFNFLPGFGSNLISKVEHGILRAHWRRQDEKARAKNSLPSWHKIDPVEMLGE